MKPHLQTLVNLLSKNDLKGMLDHYLSSTEAENLSQLALLFQQAQKNQQGYELFQELATKFIQNKALPKALIANINSSDILSFFTPALQVNFNFARTNQQHRNVLHFLMAGNQSATPTEHPPFNYLRAMMLFESNEIMQEALSKRDDLGLSPLELYLSANKNLSPLPNHEFTALLALIEFQSNKQAIDSHNCRSVLSAVKKLCQAQSIALHKDLHRLQLVAAYYTVQLEQLL